MSNKAHKGLHFYPLTFLKILSEFLEYRHNKWRNR